jgi:integrase
MGLRSSEILGTARSDLDLDNMTMTIRHQISGSGRNAALVETKTASSAATIPLPPFVIDRLRAHLELQDVKRPVVPFGDALVFMTEGGLAINGSWFAKHFQSCLRAGLPTMRLHVRHGAASLLCRCRLAHPGVARGCSATRREQGYDGALRATAGQQRRQPTFWSRPRWPGLHAQNPHESVTVSVRSVVESRQNEPEEVF